MIKNITLFIIIAVGMVGLAGCSTLTEKVQNGTSEKQKTISETQNANTEQIALYTDFTQERYAELLGKKPFAIFFYASWCPDCVNLEKQIMQNIENLPKEAIILKANYDTEIKLKRDYGITVQSTVVVIDKNGNAMPTLFGPSFNDLKTAMENSL